MRVFVFLIIFFSFFDLFTQLPIMTPLAASLGATPFLTGLAVGMYSFSNTIGNVASGFITDKKGPSFIIKTGLLLTGVILLLYSLAAHPWLLLILRFLHGLAAGFITPAAFTYVANTTAKEKKGKNAALTGAFVGLAAIVGPAFSGIVASKTNEVTVLCLTGAFMLLLAIVALLVLPKYQKPASFEKQTESIPVRFLFRNPLIMKSFAGAFFLMFSQGVLAYMLPLKVEQLGYDARTSGMLLSTFGIVAVLIFVLPINRLFDIVKPIKTLSFGMTTMGLSFLLISSSQDIFILYVLMAFYGIGFAFLFPSLNTLLIEATEETHRGKAYGYFYAFFSFGVVFGSGTTGLLELSSNQGFVLTGTLLVIISAFILFKKNSRFANVKGWQK
ncbi:MFS transporter [Bacillus litorisediminis]|uniref:MFS transporter n=1 Tax=Bacillus litorisediminis TaxID=2922713 RepID=UPI001FAD2323